MSLVHPVVPSLVPAEADDLVTEPVVVGKINRQALAAPRGLHKQDLVVVMIPHHLAEAQFGADRAVGRSVADSA